MSAISLFRQFGRNGFPPVSQVHQNFTLFGSCVQLVTGRRKRVSAHGKLYIKVNPKSGMGGIVSAVPSGVKPEWMDVFKAMKLTRGEVIQMLEIYNKVDCDGSGNIDVVELLTLLDIERTAFTERIFSAFDKDHTGQIDFYEFTVSVWKFCTLGEGSISKCALVIFCGFNLSLYLSTFFINRRIHF